VIVTTESSRGIGAEPDLKAEMSAAMSHELANALAAISGWVELARSGKRVDEALELIERVSTGAYGIARRMLGRTDGAPEARSRESDVSAFVEEATRLLVPKALQSGVEVKTDIAPGLRVPGSRDDVWSVILNPMLNAVEAMPRGGRLSVELEGGPESVTFTVTDNGPGIDERNLVRIFQPYFTTKARGTGIGLATVKRAVDEMGGTIQLSSSRGRGTSIRIDLPRLPPEAAREDSGRGGSDHRRSGVYYSEPIEARILLVDDNPALREMIYTALSMRGAQVVAVASPDRALAAEGHFDLALVDLQLGEQAGDAVLAELRRTNKITAALLVTGSDPLPEMAEGANPDSVLRKPFQLDELYERVLDLVGKKDDTERAAG
jgi:CheY-like chemotaxis protein